MTYSEGFRALSQACWFQSRTAPGLRSLRSRDEMLYISSLADNDRMSKYPSYTIIQYTTRLNANRAGRNEYTVVECGGCYDVHIYISVWHAFFVLRSIGRLCMASRQRGEVGVVLYGSDLWWPIRSVVTVRVVYLFSHALLVRDQCTQCG